MSNLMITVGNRDALYQILETFRVGEAWDEDDVEWL